MNTINGVGINPLTARVSATGGFTGPATNTINGVGVDPLTARVSTTGGFTGPATNTINDLNIAVTGGAITNTTTTSNRVGGVTLNNGTLSNITTISNSSSTTSGSFSTAGAITTGAATSNQVGGVTLNNGAVSGITTITMNGALSGGTTISNSSSTTSGSFSTAGTTTSSNFIGTKGNTSTNAPPFITPLSLLNGGGGATAQMDMQWSGGGAGYNHYIASRHAGFSVGSTGNAIDFWLYSTSGGSTASSSPGTGNVNTMSVTAAGVGIFCNAPQSTLDVFTPSTGIGTRFQNSSAHGICTFSAQGNLSGGSYTFSNAAISNIALLIGGFHLANTAYWADFVTYFSGTHVYNNLSYTSSGGFNLTSSGPNQLIFQFAGLGTTAYSFTATIYYTLY